MKKKKKKGQKSSFLTLGAYCVQLIFLDLEVESVGLIHLVRTQNFPEN